MARSSMADSIGCAVILALTRPLGGYLTRLFEGERTMLLPVLRPAERAPPASIRSGSSTGSPTGSPCRGCAAALRAAATADPAAAQSPGPRRTEPGPVVQ